MEEEIRILDDISIGISQERVLEAAGCVKGTRTYGKALALLPELEAGLRGAAAPRAWIAFGRARWYCLLTLGGGVEPYLSACVKEGLLKGVAADSMAQEFLFAFDGAVTEILRQECADREMGISRRLEAPCQLPFEAQKEILEEIERHIATGIRLSENYVFTPPRTLGYILETCPDPVCFHAAHSCSGCGSQFCPRRNNLK